LAKQTFLICALIIAITTLSSTLQAQVRIQTTQKTIVLDPGHGGNDPGIVSTMGDSEKDITLQLAQQIAKSLEDRYNITMTRSKDINLPLEQRVGRANQVQADLYVSIHLNNSNHPMTFGYYYAHPDPDLPQPDKTDTRWKMLALHHKSQSREACLSFKTIFSTQKPPRKIHIIGAPVRILQGTFMPAVLIEAFPISHLPQTPDTRTKLIDDYAELIAKSIHQFFNKK